MIPLSKNIIEGVLHYNAYINERIIESYKYLEIKPKPILEKNYFTLSDYLDKQINTLEFNKIVGGKLIQGYHNTDNYISDNQKPSFDTHVKSFEISQTPVTERLFIKFIEAGGYENQSLWTIDGWKWKEENYISCPLYWFKKGGKWFKKSLIKMYV